MLWKKQRVTQTQRKYPLLLFNTYCYVTFSRHKIRNRHCLQQSLRAHRRFELRLTARTTVVRSIITYIFFLVTQKWRISALDGDTRRDSWQENWKTFCPLSFERGREGSRFPDEKWRRTLRWMDSSGRNATWNRPSWRGEEEDLNWLYGRKWAVRLQVCTWQTLADVKR